MTTFVMHFLRRRKNQRSMLDSRGNPPTYCTMRSLGLSKFYFCFSSYFSLKTYPPSRKNWNGLMAWRFSDWQMKRIDFQHAFTDKLQWVGNLFNPVRAFLVDIGWAFYVIRSEIRFDLTLSCVNIICIY